jgi:hypothetical protein
MPSSPAKTEVVARLSPGAHQTQSRRRLSAKLAVAEQTLQHAATHHHHHCGRAHRSTSPPPAPLVTSTVQHLMLQWPESPHPDSQREGLRHHARGRRPGVQGPTGSSTPSAKELPMAASNDPSRRQRQAIPAAGAVHPDPHPLNESGALVRRGRPAPPGAAARSGQTIICRSS